MIVRKGEPDDIPALQAIEKKARTVYAALAGFEFVAANPPIAADRFISETTFVAEVSELLVGFALIQPMDGALYLANISVVPYASKCGVGAGLLERVIAHARATQATAVTLATFRRHSPDTQRFRARIALLGGLGNSNSPSPREEGDRSWRLTAAQG
jgi:predicted N-acetyltransferase YhbS